jgi:ketosteroid isomerase-like protein
MKLPFVVVPLLVAAMCVSGCMPQGESPEQMLKEAKALDERFIEAYSTGDIDAMMALYWKSPDLVSCPPGEMMVRGWDDLKEAMVKDFATSPKGKLEMFELHNTVAGDVVLGSGKWRYTMTDPPMEMVGRYTDVKAKKDGKWVYIMDHGSVPLPPPPGN